LLNWITNVNNDFNGITNVNKMIEERIKQIMATYGLTAGSFAEILGVQASNISHILSGRNKPSLDFIIRVLTKFPELDWNWLVLGKGSMKKLEECIENSRQQTIKVEETFREEPSLFDEKPVTIVDNPSLVTSFNAFSDTVSDVKEQIPEKKTSTIDEKIAENENCSANKCIGTPKRMISRIIVFYNDSSYEELSK
jgi:transcriptional regulator with XRE-family HTH domain